ncbi:hypothetical protein RRG08_009460 [Elysia crispata]|uniref:Uncharacterized protein n=1 Tax=Elysia crispata TaxID=231223 RepID=A0AAE0YX11_9GAST|nr:hypothetical protein RRG08_009460 [Elysia crispata]
MNESKTPAVYKIDDIARHPSNLAHSPAGARSTRPSLCLYSWVSPARESEHWAAGRVCVVESQLLLRVSSDLKDGPSRTMARFT